MFIFLMTRRRTRRMMMMWRTRRVRFVSLVSSQGAGHQLVPGALLIEHGLVKTGVMMVVVVMVVVVMMVVVMVIMKDK